VSARGGADRRRTWHDLWDNIGALRDRFAESIRNDDAALDMCDRIEKRRVRAVRPHYSDGAPRLWADAGFTLRSRCRSHISSAASSFRIDQRSDHAGLDIIPNSCHVRFDPPRALPTPAKASRCGTKSRRWNSGFALREYVFPKERSALANRYALSLCFFRVDAHRTNVHFALTRCAIPVKRPVGEVDAEPVLRDL